MLGIFNKIWDSVDKKVKNDEPDLYVPLAFPIIFAFILTFAISRLIGYLITYGFMPQIYYQPSPGLHVHHFTYGIFILFIAGYIGLATTKASTKFWLALLHGFGLGLAMDEFGMWLKLRDDAIVRWSYDGFSLTIAAFLLILTIKPGIRMLKWIWPWKKHKEEDIVATP